MNSTFVCIRCDKPFPVEVCSQEHVIPSSMGGSLTLLDLCKPCNDVFGHAYDVTLTENLLVQFRRRRFGLASQSGRVPDPIGEEGALVEDPEIRVRLDREQGVTVPAAPR